jgi:hypothetical protein
LISIVKTVLMREMDKKTTIRGIDQIDIITNGSISSLKRVRNPNQVGQVVNMDTNEVLSDITPMMMIVNQGAKDCVARVMALQICGGDFHKEISYYNRTESPYTIAMKYRDMFDWVQVMVSSDHSPIGNTDAPMPGVDSPGNYIRDVHSSIPYNTDSFSDED